jgi:hypothetical protein
MNKIDNYKELLQVSYENDKAIQSIIHFSGLSIFFDQYVSQRVKEIRFERSKTFFDELEKGLIQLDDETIKSEDYLKILDELSYREIQALNILDSFYSTPRDPDDSDLKWTVKFWDEFVSKLSAGIEISPEKIDGFMIRVSRTGCYELFTGKYVSDTGGRGILTPTFFDLKEYALKLSAT